MYRALRVLFFLLFILPSAAYAQTAEVRLAWDPPTGVAVTGYYIDFGTKSGVYSQSVDVGARTDHLIQGLLPGAQYFFAVRAYDGSGLTSSYSNEIAYTVPPPGSGPGSGPDLGTHKTELIWRHTTSGDVARWQMSGRKQLWGEPVGNGPVDKEWKIAGVGDLNGDGDRDLVWQHISGFISVWLMRGQKLMAGWSLKPGSVADTQWQIAGVADIDQDKQPDLVWQHAGTGQVSVWYMNGTSLREGKLLSGGQGIGVDWKVAGVGDFNGDRSPDLLWRHRTTGSMAIWFMDKDRQAFGQPVSPGSVELDWRVAAISDMNGDSMADVVWQHTDGRLAVWTMSSWTMTAGISLEPAAVSDPLWQIVAGR